MIFIQSMIFLFGATSIWFVSRKETWKRWGYIIGLCGQPFWFYMAWKSNQFGVILLTVFYTYSWIQGIYNYWILPKIISNRKQRKLDVIKQKIDDAFKD